MMKKPTYEWNKDTGTATCTIVDDAGRQFVGIAQVHPQDTDFASEKTGYEIAATRAAIAYLKSIKRDIIKPQISALNQLYYSMKHSSKFNPFSYENIMLQRQIRLKQDDLATIEQELITHRQYLKAYINEKDKFYQAVRKKRAQQNSTGENN